MCSYDVFLDLGVHQIKPGSRMKEGNFVREIKPGEFIREYCHAL